MSFLASVLKSVIKLVWPFVISKLNEWVIYTKSRSSCVVMISGNVHHAFSGWFKVREYDLVHYLVVFWFKIREDSLKLYNDLTTLLGEYGFSKPSSPILSNSSSLLPIGYRRSSAVVVWSDSLSDCHRAGGGQDNPIHNGAGFLQRRVFYFRFFFRAKIRAYSLRFSENICFFLSGNFRAWRSIRNH